MLAKSMELLISSEGIRLKAVSNLLSFESNLDRRLVCVNQTSKKQVVMEGCFMGKIIEIRAPEILGGESVTEGIAK